MDFVVAREESLQFRETIVGDRCRIITPDHQSQAVESALVALFNPVLEQVSHCSVVGWDSYAGEQINQQPVTNVDAQRVWPSCAGNGERGDFDPLKYRRGAVTFQGIAYEVC